MLSRSSRTAAWPGQRAAVGARAAGATAPAQAASLAYRRQPTATRTHPAAPPEPSDAPNPFTRATLRRKTGLLESLRMHRALDADWHTSKGHHTPRLPPPDVIEVEAEASKQRILRRQAAVASLAARDPDNAAREQDLAVAAALKFTFDGFSALRQHRSTVAACQYFRMALFSLERHAASPGAAPALQKLLLEVLQEYAPRTILELLSLPLDRPDLAHMRARGLALLRLLVESLPTDTCPVAPAVRQAYLEAARALLKPEEIVVAFADPPRLELPMQQRRDALLALVAQGMSSGQPQLVATAAERLESLRAAEGSDVDRAACCFLLGDVSGAALALGLTGKAVTAAAGDPNHDPRAFVLAHCSSPDDLLPGLWALTAAWLTAQVWGGTRPETASLGAPSLSSWFEQPHVQQFIEARLAVRRCVMLLKAAAALPAAAVAFVLGQLGRLQRVLAAAAGNGKCSSPQPAPSPERDLLSTLQLNPYAPAPTAFAALAFASCPAAGSSADRPDEPLSDPWLGFKRQLLELRAADDGWLRRLAPVLLLLQSAAVAVAVELCKALRRLQQASTASPALDW